MLAVLKHLLSISSVLQACTDKKQVHVDLVSKLFFVLAKSVDSMLSLKLANCPTTTVEGEKEGTKFVWENITLFMKSIVYSWVNGIISLEVPEWNNLLEREIGWAGQGGHWIVYIAHSNALFSASTLEQLGKLILTMRPGGNDRDRRVEGALNNPLDDNPEERFPPLNLAEGV